MLASSQEINKPIPDYYTFFEPYYYKVLKPFLCKDIIGIVNSYFDEARRTINGRISYSEDYVGPVFSFPEEEFCSSIKILREIKSLKITELYCFSCSHHVKVYNDEEYEFDCCGKGPVTEDIIWITIYQLDMNLFLYEESFIATWGNHDDENWHFFNHLTDEMLKKCDR